MKPEISPTTETAHSHDATLASPLQSGGRLIVIESVDSTVVLKMNADRIDNTPEAAVRLLKEIRTTLEHLQPKPERVVLSLRDLDYLGLSAVGALLEIHQGSQPQHGRFPPFALADLEEQPREKLRMTRLDTIIPTFNTIAEAIENTSWPKAA